MKRQIIFITAILILSITLVAKDKTRLNSISVHYGIGHLKIQDLLFSPMIHKDWSPESAIISYSHSDKLEYFLYVKFGQYQSSVVDTSGYYSSFGLDVWTRLAYCLHEKHEFTMNLALPVKNSAISKILPCNSTKG